MNQDILSHLPRSFQIWQKIEEEAEKRASERFEKILKQNKQKAVEGSGQQHDKHSDGGYAIESTLPRDCK